MNYIEEYYSGYDEDGRLLSRHGQVEYLTTMKYVHEVLNAIDGADNDKRILEVGAGTGRYCITLAQEGYRVDAVELTTHNLGILRSKLSQLTASDSQENFQENFRGSLTAIQGNALDLSVYEDGTFDVTLLLGPMYHLYTDADRYKALSEAVRVTKPGGYICVAYCMNESVMLQEAFIRGGIKDYLKRNMISSDFHCISQPEDLFVMMRMEDIYKLTADLPVTRLRTVATDGATNYMRPIVDAMDDETFDYYMQYHLCTCERQDLIGASNHSLDILQKNATQDLRPTDSYAKSRQQIDSHTTNTPTLSSERLTLRKFRLSDAEAMYRNYASDERVTKFLVWTPYTDIAPVREYLSGVIRDYSAKPIHYWAIEYEHEVIGSISTIDMNTRRHSCEIGYCLGYDYWNKGIMSEALSMIIKYLFEEGGMHRIAAKHDVENPASGKVMRKCNMTYEGRLCDHYCRHDGSYSDALVYSIIKA